MTEEARKPRAPRKGVFTYWLALGARPREALSPSARVVVPAVMSFVVLTLLGWTVMIIGFVAAMIRYAAAAFLGG